MTPRRAFNFPWRSRRRIEEDVEHELAFHIESRVRDLVSSGVQPGDAEARARREFGDVDDARRYMMRIDGEIERSQRRREHMRDLLQNVRYAARRMRAAPGFTFAAVATLALGLGANTAVFSVVDAALLRPLPYPTADRVAALYTEAPFGPFSTSPPDFTDWRSETRSFGAMTAFYRSDPTLTGVGEPIALPAAHVTEGFFDVLGVRPAIGRAFTSEEWRFGNTNFVILSDGMWRQNFGGEPDVVGSTILLGGNSHRIVGVMPPGFAYPGRTQLWRPLAFSPNDLATQRGAHYLDVLGLLKPGVTFAAAEAELDGVSKRLAELYPRTNKDYTTSIFPLRDDLVGGTPKRALLVLLIAVGLVALIACANVANLVLARGTARAREISVRLALGATTRDLMFMSLTESVLLALLGGVSGLLLAKGLAGGLDALRPAGLREMGDLRIDLTVGAFTFALSLIAGVLFGIAPGLQAGRRRNVQRALQAGGRADAGDRNSGRLRSTLVAAEIAIAVVLLSGAGLLIKSFALLQRVDPGFDARNVLVFSLGLPDARYPKSEQAAQTYREILDRLAAVPGVASAGAMSMLPLDGKRYGISTSVIDGQRIPSEDQVTTQIRSVTPEALPLLKVALRSGRLFDGRDHRGGEPAVILNESAARVLFKETNPLGHSLRIGTRFTEDTARAGGSVVGVVADMRDRALGRTPSPIIYFPHSQAPWGDMSVMVRVREGMDAAALIAAVREQVHGVDRLLPVVDPRTMDDVVRVSVAQPRFATLLMSVFAALALVLALIGVAGVMAYVVGQRTREIGIRMALGATQRRVVLETLRNASVPLMVGVGAGVAGTIAVVRLLESLLYGVAPRDPMVLAAVPALLFVAALLAAYLPARRASVVDPLIAVRND